VLLAGGLEKVEAISGLLRAGLVKGLIVDGDTGLAIVQRLRHTSRAGRQLSDVVQP